MAACLFVGITSTLLLPLPTGWSSGWRGELLNRMHSPLMGICCVALIGFFNSQKAKCISILAAAFSAIGLAAMIELMQPWFHRTADVGDFLWDMVGIVAGTLWGLAIMLQPMGWRLILRTLALTCLLAPPVGWTVKVMMAHRAADKCFPILTNFNENLGGFFWTIEPALNPAFQPPSQHGQMILERTSQTAASAHLDARNHDWTRFDRLELDGTLEAAESIEIGVRIDLNHKDGPRLRAGGQMLPGRHRIQIQWPTSQPPQNVHQLVVFLAAGNPTARLSIHQLRLLERADVAKPQIDP